MTVIRAIAEEVASILAIGSFITMIFVWALAF